jgi:hypothetical protein
MILSQQILSCTGFQLDFSSAIIKPKLKRSFFTTRLTSLHFSNVSAPPSLARQMFYKGDFLFSYDLKSAYHHIMMHPMDITYLGFQWKSKFYVFNVLCFTTCGFNSTREIHPFINNLSISSETKLLLSLADLLLSNDMFTGRVLNGNL